MKIAVLIKEVPDTYGDRKLDPETGLADRDPNAAGLDEIGERALEVALSYADDNPGAEVVIVSMGPSSASNSLRKGLAMGATSVVHITDERLRGADLRLTAEVLSAAIRRISPDLIVTGNLSTDGIGGIIPSAVAERLGMPSMTSLSSVEFRSDSVSGTRKTEDGELVLEAALPLVISITEAFPGPRFPSFKGIMAAKKKPYETLGLSDLDVHVDEEATSRSILLSVAERPARPAGTRIVDDGTAADQLADFLVANRYA